ncbi:MAG: hypothetical protein SVW57_01775 [Thermodesulfobacteriota bacterium]|nr:hypothetical protein [Thermodesulfobacteriota bacterium]
MLRSNRPYTRRNYLVKKEFQVAFIMKFCLLLVVGILISTGLLFLFSQSSLTSSFQNSKLVIENTGLAILPSVVYTNLIIFALLSMVTVLLTLFISHKIAGPMFRFEKELKEIAQGNLTQKILLRKKDQINEIADCLNNMTESLREKVFRIRTEVEGILESASHHNVPQDLIEKLNHLHQDIESSFKI